MKMKLRSGQMPGEGWRYWKASMPSANGNEGDESDE